MKIRVGECSQCGACCDNWRGLQTVQKLEAEGIPYILGAHFPCYDSHFENGKCICGIYDKRPLLCRQFPITEGDLLDYPECSYKFKTI